ncbi:MAG TPA: 30S ribosomal protein S10 [bacterium]|jgi:small subunit ribosomal protein S10|nr:MAG: 30S ribosomal protein S10 [bacterium ADurb.Bin236]HOC92620.1 30S ribosomal protein S10 [bacterium]HOY62225.1 30S ribosomal protein S10 [bacterium]HPN94063.1 30S ribosomal protein S10 [bacterium]
MATKFRIRIKLKSFDHNSLDAAAVKIVDTVKGSGAVALGPVPLPVNIERFCVLRSPHVDKKSREHFEIRTHKRLIDIDSPTPATIEALKQLELPSGVDIEIK